MMEYPKISIVTVCYNAVNEVEMTILSVINQTYPNVEYIVVDGGSTDGTVDVIRKYDSRITKWVSEPDKGIYDAMNKGIGMATGEWLNFMNAGDKFVDMNVLKNISINFNSLNGVLYGDTVGELFGGKFSLRKADIKKIENPRNCRMGFTHQSSFVRTELAKKYPFDLRFKLAADYNMMVSLYNLGYSFKYVSIPISVYDGHGISAQNVYLHRLECLTVRSPKSTFTNRLTAWLISTKLCTKLWLRSAVSKRWLDWYYQKFRKHKYYNP